MKRVSLLCVFAGAGASTRHGSHHAKQQSQPEPRLALTRARGADERHANGRAFSYTRTDPPLQDRPLLNRLVRLGSESPTEEVSFQLRSG